MTNQLDDLLEIGQLLTNGGIILCPTDTIWGLSCDAYNHSAVAKIYDIKQRDKTKPLILLVSNLDMLNKYTTNLHPRVENLIDLYKKPLTVIHQISTALPIHLQNESRTIAIRLTQDSNLSELIDKLGRPIVSTSANIQGQAVPYNYELISDKIKNAVDYIFHDRRHSTAKNPESTIIKYNEDGELFFIR